MLVDYQEVPGIIYANGGITTLIHSMNAFNVPIKTFASQTIELAYTSKAEEEGEQKSECMFFFLVFFFFFR